MRTRTLRRPGERNLVITLVLLFILPLALTTVRCLPHMPQVASAMDRLWLGSVHLGGVTVPPAYLPPTWNSVRHSHFQRYVAQQFNERFAGRELLVRCMGELWFRLFHETANPSSNVAIGEDDVLFEKNYLDEHFRSRNSKAGLAPWLSDLRQLQDFCRRMDMGFVLVLAPGKSSIYPEKAPRIWRRSSNPEPRAHDLLSELCREKEIVFVDGVDITLREKLKLPPVPLFPKGGTHWNRRAALAVANGVQAKLAEQSKSAASIGSLGSKVSDYPEGDDKDILSLMNLAFPWRYPCETMEIERSTRPGSERMTMVIIGDSFTWELQRIFGESAQYSHVDSYFYYTLYKTWTPPGPPAGVRQPATPIDFHREIFAADCLVLELNEAVALNSTHFLAAFVRDALAHLPQPGTPDPPSRPQ
jgi:hypothetical protein